MNPDPGPIIPIDLSIGPDDLAYQYRVVVTAHCGDQTFDNLLILHEDSPLSTDEAEDIAIHAAATEAGLNNATSPLPSGAAAVNCVYTARVVSVGRRSDIPAIPQRR